MKVVEPIIEKEEEQITFTFDMPAMPTFERVEQVEKIEAVEETKIVFDLSESVNEIVVNEPVQFVPVTELNEGGIIKYSLEEYMELENDLLNSKPSAATIVEEPIAEELNITMKVETTEKPSAIVSYFEDISPVEMTIEETLKHRADDRRKKLKEFNYKFHNNPSKIEEMDAPEIIHNLKIINTKLSKMTFQEIFKFLLTLPNENAYNKAKELNFFLGLTGSFDYNPVKWINHIKNPDNLFK
jgi:cell division protein FtsZ